MPKTVNIDFFRIAETRVNESEVRRWFDRIGVVDAESFLQNASDAEVSDPAFVIALAAKRCYMSFEVGLNPNVTKVRSDYVEYFDNILKSGHGSVLEHAVFTFAIEGVSRVFTAEMNRHRAGWAISEGSLRFIRFDQDIPYWLPESIAGDDILEPVGEGDRPSVGVSLDLVKQEHELEVRKQLTRESFDRVFKFVEREYGFLLDVWNMDESNKDFSYKKKVTSCLRRIVPLGVATGGVWTGNVRALRHVLAMRCSPAAEEEIAHVFTRVADSLVADQPLLFGDFSKPKGYYEPKYSKV